MPRCSALDAEGRRCARHAVTARKVHGAEYYAYPAWWQVDLCEKHDTDPDKRWRPRR